MFDILFQIGVGLRGKRFEQGAVDIAFEDCRMNVAAPADRRRVAEMLRDLLDGAHDRLLPLALGIVVAETPQRLSRELRAGPGAEVFCGDILPRAPARSADWSARTRCCRRGTALTPSAARRPPARALAAAPAASDPPRRGPG